MHVRFLLLLFQCCITLAYQAGSVFAKPNIESSQLQCRRMKSNEAVEDHLSSDIFRPSDEILCVIEVAGADGEQILGTTQELFNMFDVTVTYMSTQNSIPVRPEGKPSTEMHQNVTFFSFVPQIPGQVRVFVTEKETGRTIAKGTFILDVYSRPVHMDPFICRNSIIALRSKTLCTAIAHAENKTDLVYVAEEDIFIEVHPPKALKVRLIPGLSRVQLQLEAPIEMPVKDKMVVVNVVSEYGHNTSSEKMYRTIQLELMYPKLSATDHSILTCDSFSNVCTVATRDDIGPVFVDTSTLGIAFDPASASVMKAQWVPGADEAHAQLHYRSTMEHRVIRGMLSVFIDATVSHIMGSPVNYIYGIPPTAHTARIQGCSTVQSLIPGGTQGCRIRVLSNVTADVEYVTVSATEGIISMAPTFYKDEYEQGWHFEYTAPTLAEFGNRTYSEVEVHVTIDGNEVDGAPIHFLISNRNSLIDEVELKKHRKIVVFIGTAVFSAMIAGSLVAVLFKQAAREKTS